MSQITSEQWYWIIGAAIAVIFIVAMVFILRTFFKRQKVKKHGIEGSSALIKALNQNKRRHMRLINDVTLPDHGKEIHFDHILVGYFGVLVIDSYNTKGEIYGTTSDKEWTHLYNNKRTLFPNPVKENQARLNTLRYVFQKEKLFKNKLEGLIIIVDPYTNVYIDRGLPMYHLRELKKYFKLPLFQEDNGTDIERICETIHKNEIKK